MTQDDPVPIAGGVGGNPRRQILVLHGGGYRGLYTASVIENLQQELKQPILDAFHMIAGTSIGGIIALALADGMSPSAIREKIETEGPSLFPHYRFPGRVVKFVKRLFAAPHSQARLKNLVADVLESNERLEQLDIDVVIPSLDATGGPDGPQPVIFTNKHRTLKKTKLVDVALSTSAAPTYFASHQMPASSRQLVDGGVIANSPSWIALTTAIAEFGWNTDSIRMVVIGTTTAPQGRVPRESKTARWGGRPFRKGGGEGFLYWLRKGRLLSLLMNGQQRLADEMCRQALEPGYFKEINSFRSAEQDRVAKSLDQASDAATSTLKSLAQAAAEDARSDQELMRILNYKAR